jgi:DNA-binding response OmpR family regulator
MNMSMTDSQQKLRILVVDDDPDTTGSLAMLLGKCGHEVFMTLCAEPALSLLKSFPMDVVILDFLMPDADGFSVARRLPDSVHRPALIGISGDIDAANAAAASGIEYFLTKPVQFAELRDVLERVRSHRRANVAH